MNVLSVERIHHLQEPTGKPVGKRPPCIEYIVIYIDNFSTGEQTVFYFTRGKYWPDDFNNRLWRAGEADIEFFSTCHEPEDDCHTETH